MRKILAAILIASLTGVASSARAQPSVSPGYAHETLRLEGTIFSGLASDGDDILVTDLGNGGFHRLHNGVFTSFGPKLPKGPDVMGDPTGPYTIAKSGSGYIVAQGWTPVDGTESPNDHALIEIDDSALLRVISNDFWNPFRFRLAGEEIYVVDSGHNTIEKLSKDGKKTTLFSFARIKSTEDALTNLSPTEFSGATAYEVDAVPTGIAIDGERLHVSLFGGFPFAEGTGRIVSMTLSGSDPKTEISELNCPVDMAVAGDRILVLEHGLFDQATGFKPGSGRLVAVDRKGGERSVVIDGLTRPVSFLLRENGEIVISELGDTLHFLKPQSSK
jgi:hypothetical protein